MIFINPLLDFSHDDDDDDHHHHHHFLGAISNSFAFASLPRLLYVEKFLGKF
jgi:hypothetical protein